MIVSRIFLLIVILLLASCRQVRKISDVFEQPTPRELYARNFVEGDSIYTTWNNAFESALQDSLRIDLPYNEVGSFVPEEFLAFSFNARLSQGERLGISITSDSDSIPMFVDIYRFDNSDSLRTQPLLGEKNYGLLPTACGDIA